MIRSGLIGRSILASRSPALHEGEARAQGIDLSYELFDFTARGWSDGDLANVLTRLTAEGFAGFNVTYPFKQDVMPLLDELADSAIDVGAVNTVTCRDGRLVGHNTDMTGFRDALAEGLPGAARDTVLQLGAGGAGSAVATALLALGTGCVELSDVDTDRAHLLADRLQQRFGAGRVVVRSVGDHDTTAVSGIVNATPMGMASAPGTPIAADRLRPDMWVADIVYFPLETELLRQARRLGCRTLDGSGMVVGQAALAFSIITGLTADKRRMTESFLQGVAR